MISIEELIDEMSIVEIGKCSYLPDQTETLRAIRCPGLPNELHAQLMERGYRHSGELFYLPVCQNCKRCLPMRIDPYAFTPSKKQRHIFRKNADVEIHIAPPEPTADKLNLFRRYSYAQHADMPNDNLTEAYTEFYSPIPSLAEIQFVLNDKLIGLTIADIIPNCGLSSVYHFFDPDHAKRSIGVFSMLVEIQLCKCLNIPFYYPGFWIPECKKMCYKAHYKPNQILLDGVWVDNV